MPHTEPEIHAAIEDAIARAIRETRTAVSPAGPVGEELVDAVASAVSGGKRMRAAALMASFEAHGGEDIEAAASAAAALELFQAAALVHDDVLDDAHTRRGRPTTHLVFAKEHAHRGGTGDADRFGLAGAVLAGDLSLVVATRAMTRASLAHPSTLSLFTEMTELVTVGQYLDMRIAAAPLTTLGDQLDAIRATMRAKTASYTAEFPLALGASAARGDGPHIEAARAAGLPAGIAFQLRDDLLGLVGAPDVTGKPVGGDIREGKRTVPLWHAWTRSGDAGRAVLEAAVGRPDASETAVSAAIAVVRESGAIEAVEAQIDDLTATSDALVRSLDIPASAREALVGLLARWGARAA